jgi:hypothetical protein
MASRRPLGITIPLTSCIPAIRLRQLSLALHKYFSLVSASFSHLFLSDDDQVTPEYLFDIEHAYSSSNEASACLVEPGSAEDVGEIVR